MTCLYCEVYSDETFVSYHLKMACDIRMALHHDLNHMHSWVFNLGII